MGEFFAEVKIEIWFRESTNEWVTDIIYVTKDVAGNARFPGKTKEESRNAALAGIGHTLLETVWMENEFENEVIHDSRDKTQNKT